MVLVVVVLFVFRNDCLELCISVRVVRAPKIFPVQDVIGHVLAPHVLCVAFNILLHKGIPVCVPATMAVAFLHDCLQLSIVQGKEISHTPAGRFSAVSTVP